MCIITVEPFSIPYNKSLYTGVTYRFSPAFYLEFGDVHSEDNSENTSSGSNQFRIDHTKIGRYECEFLDHSFGYRGENEVTLLATPRGPEWAVRTSIPSGVYQGCSIILLLDQLGPEDTALFEKLGIDLGRIIKTLDVAQRWYKFTGAGRLTGLMEALYAAHAAGNKEILYLKVLEILVRIAQCDGPDPARAVDRDFYSARHVKAVKDAHAYILAHFTKRVCLEALIRGYDISYALFNKIFKAIYGETPYQYLKKLRISKAARMLLETDLTVLEIAEQVGYVNPSQFSASFKSVLGTLPSVYRKEKIGTGYSV